METTLDAQARQAGEVLRAFAGKSLSCQSWDKTNIPSIELN
jgi:hypothetical protein